MLSDDSDSGEDLDQITINEHYAKAYAYKKERQELERREHSYLPFVPFTFTNISDRFVIQSRLRQ